MVVPGLQRLVPVPSRNFLFLILLPGRCSSYYEECCDESSCPWNKSICGYQYFFTCYHQSDGFLQSINKTRLLHDVPLLNLLGMRLSIICNNLDFQVCVAGIALVSLTVLSLNIIPDASHWRADKIAYFNPLLIKSVVIFSQAAS